MLLVLPLQLLCCGGLRTHDGMEILLPSIWGNQRACGNCKQLIFVTATINQNISKKVAKPNRGHEDNTCCDVPFWFWHYSLSCFTERRQERRSESYANSNHMWVFAYTMIIRCQQIIIKNEPMQSLLLGEVNMQQHSAGRVAIRHEDGTGSGFNLLYRIEELKMSQTITTCENLHTTIMWCLQHTFVIQCIVNIVTIDSAPCLCWNCGGVVFVERGIFVNCSLVRIVQWIWYWLYMKILYVFHYTRLHMAVVANLNPHLLSTTW